MQPLGPNRKPCGLTRIYVGTVPRDAMPHVIRGSWDLDLYQEINGVRFKIGPAFKEAPYWCRVWADDTSYADYQIRHAGPAHLRTLNSLTFEMDLIVLPRRSV
jgi:hypothetical protein